MECLDHDESREGVSVVDRSSGARFQTADGRTSHETGPVVPAYGGVRNAVRHVDIFVSAGGVLVVEMLFSFLENGIAYWVFIGSAVGGTVGAYLSRESGRNRIRDRETHRATENRGSENVVQARSAGVPLSGWGLVGFAVSLGFAIFGFLGLMGHLGYSGPLTWGIFAVCFIPAALLTWLLHLSRTNLRRNF